MSKERQDNSVALELKNITKLYAGTVALEKVSLVVRRGEVHGLIGKNGAGKSTLVGVVSGLVSPSSGEIIINGKKVPTLTPITAKKHHISIVTQEPQVIEEITVAENFFMPHYIDGHQFINWKEMARRATDILSQAGFPIDVSMKIRDLSISERQLLLVIKACYVEKAEIVIMDEVSASLSPKDQAILYQIIENLTAQGKTVIFISHHTEELLRVCDKVTVIRDGHNVGSSLCKDLNMKSLAALIVGNTNYDALVMEDLSSMIQPETVLQLDHFTRHGKFHDISINLKKGEIIGLAGLRGSGRTELFKSIVGVDFFDGGHLRVADQEKRYSAPAAALEDGVIYLAEEREAEGLISGGSIKSNISISILPKISRGSFIQRGKEQGIVDQLIDTLGIKAVSREQQIHQLSGGNKQKVLVAKIMACSPHVCLLDEPTRGVDIEAKESILNTINQELRKQSGVLITSPGVEDLIKICDRIIVLYEGAVIDEFARGELSEEHIYRAMQGETIHTREVTNL